MQTTVIGPATVRLLRRIDAFLTRSGMAETTLGKLALNDGKSISRLRSGGAISIERAETLRAFMRDWKPVRNVRFRPRGVRVAS